VVLKKVGDCVVPGPGVGAVVADAEVGAFVKTGRREGEDVIVLGLGEEVTGELVGEVRVGETVAAPIVGKDVAGLTVGAV
jgi:hypothetical protein